MSAGYEPVARWKQALGGVIIAAIGVAGIFWTWHMALTQGKFEFKASIGCPAFLVLGLGAIIFPHYKIERLGRGEDVSGMSQFQLVTARWWTVIVLAPIVGCLNYLLLMYR